MLLSTDAMTLVGYGAEEGIAPGWRPLLWFWCSVGAMTILGGLVLALLGPPAKQPPAEHTAPDRAAERTQADGVASAKAASPASQPLTRRAAEAAVPPVAFAAEPVLPPPASQQPQSTQPSRDRAVQPLGAPAHGRMLVVLHPVHAESGAALAARLAARAGIAADQVSVGTAGEVQTEAEIRFFSESDHEFARRLGKELAGMAYKWRLANHAWRSDASRDRAIEIWLPSH